MDRGDDVAEITYLVSRTRHREGIAREALVAVIGASWISSCSSALISRETVQLGILCGGMTSNWNSKAAPTLAAGLLYDACSGDATGLHSHACGNCNERRAIARGNSRRFD